MRSLPGIQTRLVVRTAAVVVLGLALTAAAPARAQQPPSAPKPAAKADTAPAKPAAAVPAAAPADAAPARPAESARLVEETVTLTVKVLHPAEVTAKAIAAAQEAGGWPTRVTPGQLILVVPPEAAAELVAMLEKSGILLDKQIGREDHTQELTQLEASLKTKREMLGRLRQLFGESAVDATLRIEQSMNRLVDEIERQQARWQGLQARVQRTKLDVRFHYRPKQELRNLRSPFAWIEATDLPAFLARF